MKNIVHRNREKYLPVFSHFPSTSSKDPCLKRGVFSERLYMLEDNLDPPKTFILVFFFEF